MSPAHVRQLEGGRPEPRRYCHTQVFHALFPWQYQWLIRERLPGDRITFNPFENESIGKMSARLGKPLGRTKTAPVRQTMELIESSIRWVLYYAPILLDLRDKYFE